MKIFKNLSLPKIFFGVLVLFFLIYCVLTIDYGTKEREYTKTINNITYGEVLRSSSIFVISVKNIDSIPQQKLVDFIYCLIESESKSGREISIVEISDKFLYIDQIKEKDYVIKSQVITKRAGNDIEQTLRIKYLHKKITVEVTFIRGTSPCIEG